MTTGDVTDLPKGWEAMVDPASGKTYYVDHVNKRSSWERPDARSSSSKTRNAQSSKKDPTEDEGLPDGWEARTDPKSGKTYYIDHVNKKSSWERPSMQSSTSAATVVTSDLSSSFSNMSVESSNSSNKKPFEWEGPKAKTPFPPYDENALKPVSIQYSQPFETTSTDTGVVDDSNSNKTPAWMSVIKSKVDKRRERGWEGFKANVAKNWNDLTSSSDEVLVEGVTLNEYPLTSEQARWFASEFPQIILRPHTHYWYDPSSGWIGKVGDKRKFVCDPNIDGIRGTLHPLASSSFGGQQQHRSMSNEIRLNGRLLSKEEVMEFKMLKCELEDQTSYQVKPNGDILAIVPGDKHSTTVPLFNWRQQRKLRNRNVAIGTGVAVVAVAGGGILLDGGAAGGEGILGGGGGGDGFHYSDITGASGNHDVASGAGYVMTDSGTVTYGM